MSRSAPVIAELVPIADRVRWMLGCRALLTAVLYVIWVVLGNVGSGVPGVVWGCLAWLMITTLMSALVVRTADREGGRGIAVLALTTGLLGDGLLLAVAWYHFGGLAGPVGYLVVLHGVATTLLASFRTGGKLALWHSLIALVVVEAAAAGVLDPPPGTDVSPGRLVLLLLILWTGVLATAGFAAINERELRRRRHDSEVLRRFGVALADESDTRAIGAHLARFVRDQLLAGRAVALVQPVDHGEPVADTAYAVVVDGGAAGTGAANEAAGAAVNRLSTEIFAEGILGQALADRRTHLVARLDAERDRWLSRTLPDAENLIVVPFALEQVVGAVVVEHPRNATHRLSGRADRRAVSTAEQATSHASMALGRAILVERIRATAEVDGLTQVANRRRLDAVTAQRVGDGEPFALIMVAVNDFKQLNDQYGHLTGDDVLRRAARQIATAAGEGGFAARYGGAEFTVIVSVSERAAAVEVAERIRAAVAAAETAVPVTASVGVALFPADAASPEGLLAGAGTALQSAKLTAEHAPVR